MKALRLFLLVCIVPLLLAAQTSPDKTQALVWQPPAGFSPKVFPKATISNPMISEIKIAGMKILLEDTPLEEVSRKLGAAIGSSGDAGDYLAWVCLVGRDNGTTWTLWLMSSEIDGPAIGGFQIRRTSDSQRLDRRCKTLDAGVGVETIPKKLRVGMSKTELLNVLGHPTLRRANTLWFEHEHKIKIGSEPYTVTNTVAVVLSQEKVTAIQVWKSSVN